MAAQIQTEHFTQALWARSVKRYVAYSTDVFGHPDVAYKGGAPAQQAWLFGGKHATNGVYRLDTLCA